VDGKASVTELKTTGDMSKVKLSDISLNTSNPYVDREVKQLVGKYLITNEIMWFKN
jgi:hypothetical protein